MSFKGKCSLFSFFASKISPIAYGFIKKCFLLLGCFIGLAGDVFAQTASAVDNQPESAISINMEAMVDTSGVLRPDQVMQSHSFISTNERIPIYANRVKNAWLRFPVQNHSASSTLFLNIAYTNLSRVRLYRIDRNAITLIGEMGNEVKENHYFEGSPNIIFDLKISPGSSYQYLLHVYSQHPIIVPAQIVTDKALYASVNLQNIIISTYIGILAVMFLYNLFLLIATRDYSYLYYILYILFLALAQITFAGYGYKYFWPDTTSFNKYAVVITSGFSAIAGLLFSMHFLRTFYFAKRIHKWLQFLVVIYVVGLISCFSFNLSISYSILNYNGLLGILSVLIASFYIARKHFRPAYFYLTAWMFLLVSFLILILRNLAILPYNNITTYTIYVGSSLEIALLSIALADKINILRREKELSQAEALKVSQENEKLVRDQNVLLERKVTERTEELQLSNDNLSNTLRELKDTQIQLVEAEKMASLGQLTAGIAHEINNPINFVKSNIKPLQLDIKDLVELIDAYDALHKTPDHEMPAKLLQIEKLKKQIDIGFVKEEIGSLVKGIQEGAERTAEIVQGLRNFSRLDESEVKKADIHEGLESTLLLLKNNLPSNIRIQKIFAPNGEIECFPGKLNQVFMNILSNGIQAIKTKNGQSQQEQEEGITIRTVDRGDKLDIHISDTGIGMSEEVKQKIFDPFFTTKDVGEGTGLGLSIVYKIIQKHGGRIEVVSSPGTGAEFIISLYKVLPETVLT